MGRGRAKAKQTKVARELKYREFNTDFTELQRELHGGDKPEARPGGDAEELAADEDDPYPDLFGEAAPRR